MKARHLVIPAFALVLAASLFHIPPSEKTVSSSASGELSPFVPPPALPKNTATREDTFPKDPDFTKAFIAASHRIRGLTARESLLPANDGTRFFANNPAQNLTARFHEDAILIRNPKESGDLKISRRDRPQTTLKATGNRAEYLGNDGSTEWMENGENGFEHGMTLATRPHNAGAELRFTFSSGNLTASHDPENPSDLIFSTPSGEAIYGYRSIKAWDAGGRDLPARMAPADGGFEWIVDDRSATYPVTIDPLIANFQTELTHPIDPSFHFAEGDIDGNLLVISLYTESTPSGAYAGAVYAFRHNGTAWVLEQRFESDAPEAYQYFGRCVATGNGQIAVYSATDANPGGTIGAVRMYSRPAGSWQITSTIRFPGSGFAYSGLQSFQMRGSLLVGGNPYRVTSIAGETGETGCIFYASGSLGLWPSTFGEYTPPDVQLNDSFGMSVSTDGTRIAVGSPYADVDGKSNAGKAYLLQHNGLSVSQLAVVKASDPQQDDQLGWPVAYDSGMLVAGSYRNRSHYSPHLTNNHGDGAVYVFTGTGWPQTAKIIPPTQGPGAPGFGWSLDVRGGRMAVSSQYVSSFGTRVTLFQRIEDTWFLRSTIATDPHVNYSNPMLRMDSSRLLMSHGTYNVPTTTRVYTFGNSTPDPEISAFVGNSTALREIQSGTPVHLGDAYLNQNQTWSVTIANEGGNQPLTLNQPVIRPGATPGLFANQLLFASIAPGESQKITFRTQFTSLGPASGTLRVTSNDPDEDTFDIPVTFNVIYRPALPGLTVAREGSQIVLRYPHTQFFLYQIRRSTDLSTHPSTWPVVGYMDTEYHLPTSSQIRVYRDIAPPAGKAFYVLFVD